MISQSIDVNLIPGGVLPRINVSQYDKGSRTLNFNLYNGASPYTIPANSSVYVVGTKKDNTGFDYSATYSGSTVSLDVTDQMTVFPGEVVIEIRIVKDGDQIGTGNFVLNVEPTALADDVEISETDIPIIQQLPELIAEAEGAADLAHAWATYGSSTEQPSATNNAKYWAEYAASAASAGLQPVVVQTLPTTNISTSKLYLVPSSDPQTGNLYDEYINTDGTTSGYELIGTTGVDLSAYLQKTGDAKDLTVTLTSADDSTVFNSGNLGGQSSYAWSAVTQIASGETIRSLFEKASTMFKNIRTIAKLIGTTDISTLGTGAAAGTITGALSGISSDLSELFVVEDIKNNLTPTNCTVRYAYAKVVGNACLLNMVLDITGSILANAVIVSGLPGQTLYSPIEGMHNATGHHIPMHIGSASGTLVMSPSSPISTLSAGDVIIINGVYFVES